MSDSEDSSDDEDFRQPVTKKPKLIDDAAEESGDNASDEEEDDDEINDYVKDGFVVDEMEEEEAKKQRKGELEDSEDEDDEDQSASDNDGDVRSSARKRLKKVRKSKFDALDDEDLALIQEAQQDEDMPPSGPEPMERKRVVAKTEAELRKGLFYDSEEDEQHGEMPKELQRKQVRVERYDEDGMDDFIEDDIGDQGDILASERRGKLYDDDENIREVNEAQLNEASEIFGTDYLEFMNEERPDEDEEQLLGKKYRERGVGVDLGLDSDDEIFSDSDDDDDLFGDEEEDENMGVTSEQKAEALRLKREKRKLAKAERRRQSAISKAERRKAQLRRAFEPVQLVENFCTERDELIRQADVPERFFDWTTPFFGSDKDGMTKDEENQARWIASRIPAIQVDFAAASESGSEWAILESIANALRFMHRDKLEPAFVKRYRKDYVVSQSVRENLYSIMDEDGEWDRIQSARNKVERLVMEISAAADADESTGFDAQKLQNLRKALDEAQSKLEESAKQEAVVKADLEALGDDMEDDDEEELFGGDGDNEAKTKEKERLSAHLETIRSLLEARAEKVSQLRGQFNIADAQNRALNDPGPTEIVMKKICRDSLWNSQDYLAYLASLVDSRHVLDLNGYMNLINEGNEAIRKKELPLVDLSDGKEGRRRSRRFDRDFYRTCVAEGLRSVGYRFLLAPNRVGIKLEDAKTLGHFDFSKTMAGEDSTEGGGYPLKWVPPVIPTASPAEFASELIGTGELVVLSSSGGQVDESDDPLRGCRYVAAMELAHEPRVRRYLRGIYRQNAVLTTKPSKKGMEEVDVFHDFYGVHLIRNKPVKDHFPLDSKESAERKGDLVGAERTEWDMNMTRRRRESCLQYLNILKAQQNGYISVHVHLPLLEKDDDWFQIADDRLFARSNTDFSCLEEELKKVYLPPDGDTDEWNAERDKVIHTALMSFLLPQFESELRRDLRDASSAEGVLAAGESLRASAMQGAYRPAALLHTENRFLVPTGDLPIVGVCCSSDGKDAAYLASVTERGKAFDFLAIPGGTRIDSPKVRDKVVMFLLQSRPAAVVVGTSGGFESRLVHRKMNDIIAEAMQKWKNRDIQGDDEDDDVFELRRDALRQLLPFGQYDDDEDDWKCNAELVDDSVAQLFGRSVRGKKEFPEYAVNLKSAIAVARFAKDPLAEYTYAWSVASDAGVFGTEMLYLNIHPMQQLMPRTLLLREYERVLCDVVADVGAEVNTACSMDHLRGMLMFVAGLGPRKSATVKQNVSQQGGALARRRDLLEKRMLGPLVYNNAVAFLQIRQIDQLEDQFLHPLDETRLHPDVYLRNNWAVKIAFDALEREEAKSKDSAIKALRDVMENSSKEVERLFKDTKSEWESHYGPTFNIKDWDPHVDVPVDMWRDKVEELDLHAFANMIEENGNGRWHSHLEMIKWEFRLPFADPRKPMDPLSGDKLFRLITGETDQSLRPGKELTGRVERNGDFGSKVKLEGDIQAFIPLRNLSDDHVESAEDFVHPGQVVTAVVTEVKKDHMTVDLSLKLEDFRKPPSSWERPTTLPALDDYFDGAAASRIENSNARRREARLEAFQLTLGQKGDENVDVAAKKRVGRVARRACTHPAFRNAKNDEVTNELKEGGAAMVGEALIRPSSKSSDSLALHWVVREGEIKVIEIAEEDKETDASVGNKLIIKDEVYGSIDELLGRYIAPMNDLVEELVNHRKFMDLPEDEVDEKLMEQKKSVPKSIPYALCWMDMYPGYASLRFVGSVTPRSHPIGITPKGFTWGLQTFNSLDRLVNEFKRNPKGLIRKPTEPDLIKPPPSKGRWGARAPAPHAAPASAWRPAPPPVPPIPQQLVPQQMVPQQAGWGAPPVQPAWQPQPTPQPIARHLPPLPQYTHAPPPPQYRPPPPNLPPPIPPGPPMAPPYGQPPAFDAPSPASQGRGRGRTLPAWMSKG